MGIFQEAQLLWHPHLIYKEQKTLSVSFQSEDSQVKTISWPSWGYVHTQGPLMEEG